MVDSKENHKFDLGVKGFVLTHSSISNIPALAFPGSSCNARRVFLNIDIGPASGDINVTESCASPLWLLSVLFSFIKVSNFFHQYSYNVLY